MDENGFENSNSSLWEFLKIICRVANRVAYSVLMGLSNGLHKAERKTIFGEDHYIHASGKKKKIPFPTSLTPAVGSGYGQISKKGRTFGAP